MYLKRCDAHSNKLHSRCIFPNIIYALKYVDDDSLASSQVCTQSLSTSTDAAGRLGCRESFATSRSAAVCCEISCATVRGHWMPQRAVSVDTQDCHRYRHKEFDGSCARSYAPTALFIRTVDRLAAQPFAAAVGVARYAFATRC